MSNQTKVIWSEGYLSTQARLKETKEKCMCTRPFPDRDKGVCKKCKRELK
jgi:hypothetical protein